MNDPRADLMNAAFRCEQAAERYTDNSATQRRARQILTSTAQCCRTAASQLADDPTLATESPSSRRLRTVDLLCELARTCIGRVAAAEQAKPAKGCAPELLRQRWTEAEQLHQRILDCAEQVPQIVRADHATIAGSHEISLSRLAPQHRRLRQAAELIRESIAGAMLLPYPHPIAVELADLADRIQDQADQARR